MKISVIIRKNTYYKNGTSPLFIRFSQNRTCKLISLGIAIPLEYWNSDQQSVKEIYPNYKKIQFEIDSKLKEYEKRIQRLEALGIEVNFNTLFEHKENQSNCTVSEYFKQQIERIKDLGKIGTAAKYENCLSLLSKCNPVNILFSQIEMKYLRNFESFLLSKGNTSNSIATKFSVFKAVYNRAIADRIFEPKDNPFIRFKVGKYWKPTRKRAISKEDILKLKAIELPKKGGSFYLEFARDIFLFSYYTAGINFTDIATLRWCDVDNGRIYYKRHKTSKEMSCCLMQEAQYIIERYNTTPFNDEDYIFPILNSQKHKTKQQIFNRLHKVLGKVNENLEKLSEMICLKNPLTTYTARHTYATVLKRSGVNIAIISETLGHSDLSTTQIYLDSFENSQIDEAMKNLL